MPTKSRLKRALNQETGVDFQKLHQKKVAKARNKTPRPVKAIANGGKKPSDIDDDWEAVEDSDAEGGAPISDDDDDGSDEIDGHKLDLEALDESSSSEDIDMEPKIERKPKKSPKAIKAVSSEVEEEEEEDEEEDIAMSDLESLPDEEKEDLIPHTRLSINNTAALTESLKRIAIPTDKSVPFATHQTITSIEPTADSIEDIQDDLKRELAFYAQSLEAAKRARALLKSEGVPFSRPKDYFAEMVKDDGHMELVKARLVEEASAKKASSEARKLRDLKKFGKQVQVAKLQERQKAKRDTLDKIQSLKRKRQESSGDVGTNEADLFDVGVDDEIKKHNAKKPFGRAGREDGFNAKRQKKDQKYGFGGKKRHGKSGDSESAGDLSGFSARRMKTGAKGKPGKTARLGKSRRNAGAGKR